MKTEESKNPDQPTPRLLTIPEAAELIGRDAQIVRRWIRDGRLKPAARLQGRGRAFVVHTIDLFEAEIANPRVVPAEQKAQIEQLRAHIRRQVEEHKAKQP